jgi:hypothetical protein
VSAVPEPDPYDRLAVDTPYWASLFAKIVPKQRKRGLIPLVASPAQMALDKLIEDQRAAGRPMRAVVLKSRQVGISTWIQAKLIQRTTLSAHHSALVVAHDVETGGKLFAIGQRIYTNLPHDPTLRPEIRSYRRSRFLHFGQRGETWMDRPIYPDSTYFVDTAGEFEAGRGATYHSIHASELAFWPQPEPKFIALAQTVPDDPDTLFVIESTANGHNMFKDLWDQAEQGLSEFAAFFWPWWKEAQYRRAFLNDGDRAEFVVGDPNNPYAEREPKLADPGPVDSDTGRHVPLDHEQLYWRRWAIANLCGGKIDKFDQEYPTSPEDAFLATGSRVFEPAFVSMALRQAERTDPRAGVGGPLVGRVVAAKRQPMAGRAGKVERPIDPTFKPARELLPGEDPDWRIWLPSEDGKPVIPDDRFYVAGVDVSGGVSESDDPDSDPAFHAIQVIDHETKEQVAEYRSRCDPILLAEHALLTAELFNDAWLAIEITGGYGLPTARTVWLDYRYRFNYFRKRTDAREEAQQDRLGWDTRPNTKPMLVALGQELLRTEAHGIKSRRLCYEMLTYIRLPSGKMRPEKGKFADLLLAWMIAQQVALQMPVRRKVERRQVSYRARNPKTGY